jgi:RecA-family ATPase
VVLDHVSLFHGGDFNAKEDASMTMRVVNGIAQETGAAVLLLAHSPKSAAAQEESDASMVAGSTAFVDQARGGWIMAKMRKNEAKKLGIAESAREEYVSLAGVKANYAPDRAVLWFRKVDFDEVGVLEFVQLHPPVAAAARATLQANIIAAVRNGAGQFSKTRLRDHFSGKEKSWRASKAEIDAEVEAMLSGGKLINRPPTTAEKTTFGHGPQVKHVLDLGN